MVWYLCSLHTMQIFFVWCGTCVACIQCRYSLCLCKSNHNLQVYSFFFLSFFFLLLRGNCSRTTSGPRPLDLFTKSYFPRLVFGLAYAALVLWTPHVGVQGQFPLYYYGVVVVATAIHQVGVSSLVCVWRGRVRSNLSLWSYWIWSSPSHCGQFWTVV